MKTLLIGIPLILLDAGLKLASDQWAMIPLRHVGRFFFGVCHARSARLVGVYTTDIGLRLAVVVLLCGVLLLAERKIKARVRAKARARVWRGFTFLFLAGAVHALELAFRGYGIDYFVVGVSEIYLATNLIDILAMAGAFIAIAAIVPEMAALKAWQTKKPSVSRAHG